MRDGSGCEREREAARRVAIGEVHAARARSRASRGLFWKLGALKLPLLSGETTRRSAELVNGSVFLPQSFAGRIYLSKGRALSKSEEGSRSGQLGAAIIGCVNITVGGYYY